MLTFTSLKEAQEILTKAQEARTLLESLGLTVTEPGEQRTAPKPRKVAAQKKTRHRPSDFRSAEHPYGLKADGTPARKRGPKPRLPPLEMSDVADDPVTEGDADLRKAII